MHSASYTSCRFPYDQIHLKDWREKIIFDFDNSASFVRRELSVPGTLQGRIFSQGPRRARSHKMWQMSKGLPQTSNVTYIFENHQRSLTLSVFGHEIDSFLSLSFKKLLSSPCELRWNKWKNGSIKTQVYVWCFYEQREQPISVTEKIRFVHRGFCQEFKSPIFPYSRISL